MFSQKKHLSDAQDRFTVGGSWGRKDAKSGWHNRNEDEWSSRSSQRQSTQTRVNSKQGGGTLREDGSKEGGDCPRVSGSLFKGKLGRLHVRRGRGAISLHEFFRLSEESQNIELSEIREGESAGKWEDGRGKITSPRCNYLQ